MINKHNEKNKKYFHSLKKRVNINNIRLSDNQQSWLVTKGSNLN